MNTFTRKQILRNYERGIIPISGDGLSGNLGVDPYASSNQQYLNELASIERRLADIEVQLQSQYLEQSTRDAMRDEKLRLLARKSAVQWWLSLPTSQKNKLNPLTAVPNKAQSFYSSLNKLETGFCAD